MTTFRHLSVGDLLRQQDRDGLITDPRIQDCLRAGDLVPVEFLSRLLESSFLDRENESCNFILLDGFPRRLDQIHPVQKVVRSLHGHGGQRR
jgi:adenylate kinase family enzyme